MHQPVQYTNEGLSAAYTVNVPDDFPYYRRGKYYTTLELTLEFTGTVPDSSVMGITAKRMGSTDDLTPLEYDTIDATSGAQSVTYNGTFDSITVTPNSEFLGGSATYKIIINAGETW